MRRLVLGDIHAAYKALVDVLAKAKFNPDKDLLIGIGDYVDGYSESYKVVEYLRTLPNFIGVKGNHEEMAIPWLLSEGNKDYEIPLWVTQGGQATINSYFSLDEMAKMKKHGAFLDSLPYYIELDNMLFVHGGYNPNYPISEQDVWDLTWDRSLYAYHAICKHYNNPTSTEPYDKIFVGHSQTYHGSGDSKPFTYNNFWNIDQTAGWGGVLSLVDIDTEEYWQSTSTSILYPHEQRREK